MDFSRPPGVKVLREVRFLRFRVAENCVFVGSNSLAGKYAKRIHDDRYKSWWDRGPGSIAKGTHAREKFIERAINDNESQFFAIIESETGKAIK